jgi:phosphate transport system substrate-binding protein
MLGVTLAGSLAVASASGPAASAEPKPLRIGGTGMALATIRTISKAFEASESDIAVEVLPSLGTGGGLAAVTAGAIDLALSARPLNDTERGKGLESRVYARTPLAFVTHPSAGIDRISLSHVTLIFSGGVTTWPDGGLIRLIRREPSDADWSTLRGVSQDMARAVEIALGRPGLMTVATDQENADALERLKGSFGMLSVGQMHAEARRLTPLALDDVMPNVHELKTGRYSLSRSLYAVWHVQARTEVKRFLAFLRSEQADTILTGLGHIALSGGDP